MSQELTISQIQRVRAIAISTYTASVAQILSESMHKAPTQVVASMQKMLTTESATASRASANILKSPTSLKVLQKHFEKNISVLSGSNSMNSNEILKLKTAAIMTMQQENLKIDNKALVTKSINELLMAETIQETTEKLSSTFAEIKNQHTRVFTRTLSSAIQLASTKIGFGQVKSEIVSPSLTRIVATNSKGINLISEVHTEKKGIDIISEVDGIADGSCAKIMDDFNREMETLGIVAERKERKSTGGIAQMPYIKHLRKQRGGNKREFVNEQIPPKNFKKLVQYINY